MKRRNWAAVLTVLTAVAAAAIAASDDRVTGEIARKLTEVPVRQDGERFQKAHALIQQGRYDTALPLLEQNMAETPNAADIDYSYGWAVLCAAQLGDTDRTLKYYEVVRTRFGGWQRSGAGGAHRNWDSRLAMARQAVKVGRVPDKERVLKQMDEFDRLGRDSADRELKALIRRVQAGDQVAIEQLRSTSHIQPFIDLIVDGRLKLVED